jgi:hypothetical protein
LLSYPHSDEEQEQAELLVAVLQGVAQALQAGRVAGQLQQVFFCYYVLKGPKLEIFVAGIFTQIRPV